MLPTVSEESCATLCRKQDKENMDKVRGEVEVREKLAQGNSAKCHGVEMTLSVDEGIRSENVMNNDDAVLKNIDRESFPLCIRQIYLLKT